MCVLCVCAYTCKWLKGGRGVRSGVSKIGKREVGIGDEGECSRHLREPS